MKQAVVVFGKKAVAGEVKTRLSPRIGAGKAARLYDAFARDVMVTVDRYRAARHNKGDEVATILAWDGEPDDELARFARNELGFELVEQGAGDLGDKLRSVVSRVRSTRAEQVLVTGTDSPTLSPEHLETARLVLSTHDVVFGPAFDGGYYLVGLGQPLDQTPSAESVIFEDIDWSSPKVLEQSWRRAVDAGLLCDLLGFWYDIDTFEDLMKAQFHLFEFLASRDPLVGKNTRQFLHAHPVEDDQ